MPVPLRSILSKNLLFIQNSYCVVVIRHTTVITVIVDCKQSHLRAIVLVIARIVRTWLTPPPPIRMLPPIMRYWLLWAKFGWRFWIPWGRFGYGCTVSGGGGGGGSWFCCGFPWFGFWFGLGLRRAGNLHHSRDIHIPLACNR